MAQARPTPGDLITLQEAAERLSVHYMTAYRWVRRGELPAFKTVPVEFTPDKPGEYTFTCGMNMLRGRLVVR